MDQLIKQRIVSLSATRGAGLFLSQIDFSRSLPYFVLLPFCIVFAGVGTANNSFSRQETHA